MSLATEEKTIVTDIRDGAQNALEWLRKVVDEHIPAAENDYNAAVAELRRLQSDEIVQSAEAAMLTPGERAFVAHFISEIPTLRVKSPAADQQPAEGNGDVPGDAGDQSAA
jgi:hypothetical protein